MFNDLRVFVRQSSHSPPVPYSILFYEEVLCCSYIFTLQFKTLVNCFRELEKEEKVNFFQGRDLEHAMVDKNKNLIFHSSGCFQK